MVLPRLWRVPFRGRGPVLWTPLEGNAMKRLACLAIACIALAN